MPQADTDATPDLGQRECILDAAPMPLAVLKNESLRHNIATFAGYCERHGVELAPHVKTTMSPEIFTLQREAGAWAATVATVPQAMAVGGWGAKRIVLANELTDGASLRWVTTECEADAELEIYFWVDSRDGAEYAAAIHREAGAGRPLRVLVELGHPDGRTGCRSEDEAMALATHVAALPQLELCGVSAFEGTISLDSPGESVAAVTRFISEVRSAYELMARQDLFGIERPLLTAGGSAYFDRVVEGFDDATRARVVLRSGCYVTHDCGAYDRLSPMGGPTGALQSAIEVWGAVLSVPEQGLALIGIGKRDASHDSGLPVVSHWRRRGECPRDAPDGLELFALNDQHAYVRDPGRHLSVGDLVGCCISHPCTTFDKWRRFELVDERYRPLGSISTFF